jgi:hypothetical protein
MKVNSSERSNIFATSLIGVDGGSNSEASLEEVSFLTPAFIHAINKSLGRDRRREY